MIPGTMAIFHPLPRPPLQKHTNEKPATDRTHTTHLMEPSRQRTALGRHTTKPASLRSVLPSPCKTTKACLNLSSCGWRLGAAGLFLVDVFVLSLIR